MDQAGRDDKPLSLLPILTNPSQLLPHILRLSTGLISFISSTVEHEASFKMGYTCRRFADDWYVDRIQLEPVSGK